MPATQQTVQGQWRVRALTLLPLLLVLLACCTASGDVSQPRPQGFGIGDYEYDYDELPREHLRHSVRAAADSTSASAQEEQAVEAHQQAAEALKHPETHKQPAAEGAATQPAPPPHVQHVPANAPRTPEAASAAEADTAIQRVPRVEAGGSGAEVHPAATEPVPAQQDQAPAPAAPEPPARLQGPEEVDPPEQAPEVVPTAVPDPRLAKDSKEDMETSNFFWGLGPVYPHLYVYRRVPHLVPLHGWSPYHAYYITHPSSK